MEDRLKISALRKDRSRITFKKIVLSPPQIKYFLFLLLVMIPIAQALNAEISCPESVKVNEEFSCTVKIFDTDKIYDLKIEIKKDGKSVARIYNPTKNSFQSSYYYIKNFIKDSSEIKLKIEKVGDYDAILKLRRNKKVQSFPFKISVYERDGKDYNLEEETKKEKKRPLKNKKIENDSKILKQDKKKQKKTIILNAKTKDDELIYESKNFRILSLAPYAFSVFLIIIIGFLLIDKK